MCKNKKLLVVTQTLETNEPLISNLELHGFIVECTTSESVYLAEDLDQQFDFLIIHHSIEAYEAIEVCKNIRSKTESLPIIILASENVEILKVLGLEVGADDYISQPYGMNEIIAKIHSIFRRCKINSQKVEKKNMIRCGNMEILPELHQVVIDGKVVELTAKEFELLTFLARNKGIVYKRSDLLHEIWNYDSDLYEHTVNAHINRLRSKIEKDTANPEYILTVWGVGYKFNPQIEEQEKHILN